MCRFYVSKEKYFKHTLIKLVMNKKKGSATNRLSVDNNDRDGTLEVLSFTWKK